jgi:hypothetical protein
MPVVGRKRLLAGLVGDDLQPLEQPAAAQVADIGVVAKAALETRPELGAEPRDLGHHVVVLEHLLDGDAPPRRPWHGRHRYVRA